MIVKFRVLVVLVVMVIFLSAIGRHWGLLWPIILAGLLFTPFLLRNRMGRRPRAYFTIFITIVIVAAGWIAVSIIWSVVLAVVLLILYIYFGFIAK
jgi:hypothetical protein